MNNNLMDSQNDECICSTNQGLFIPNRQLSVLITGLFFILFACFTAGYFLGKKYTAEQLLIAIHTNPLKKAMIANELAHETLYNHDNNIISENDLPLLYDTVEVSDASFDNDVINQNVMQQPEKKYCAKLISFGTEKAAKKFVQKLLLKDIVVEIKKHTNRTAKGRIIYWYQVVTIPYANKNELELLVNRLIKEEILTGVQIEAC